MDVALTILPIQGHDTVNIVRNTLSRVDPRLVEHGERVAYILLKMLSFLQCYSAAEVKNICIASLFHDIGAYKTDEIDRMLEFETSAVWAHSIYGYLFLKYLSPLSEYADAVLYHHYPYDKFSEGLCAHRDIALMIHLADRIDLVMQSDGFLPEQIHSFSPKSFDPAHVCLFWQSDAAFHLLENLKSGAYRKDLLALMQTFQFSKIERNKYLQMLAYSIDFRSEYTVAHTIRTVAYSIEIAKKLHATEDSLLKIYYGALLHDLGKVSIPLEILEFPGKLSFSAMQIMKTHVTITEEIIRGIVNDEICDIAVRHHEKLDGSGYPHGLRATDLTENQRIVAVADIISALVGKRSYKNAFSKEQIVEVLLQMKNTGKLCPRVCNVVLQHYDDIAAQVDKRCAPLLHTYAHITEEFQYLYRKLANRPYPDTLPLLAKTPPKCVEPLGTVE